MPKIKQITQVEIRHVRGISDRAFPVQIFPNKPNLLVAPNGFGKSSIAAAFASLRSGKLDIADDQKHGLEANPQPHLSITYLSEDGTTVVKTADGAKNEVKEQFAVWVINSRLRSKTRTFPVGGGRSVSTSSIEIDEIVLVDKTVAKERVSYNCTAMRAAFGKNGKILPNIGDSFGDLKLMSQITAVDFSKEDGVKNCAAIAAFKEYVNDLAGTADEIQAAIENSQLAKLAAVPHVEAIKQILAASPLDFKNDAELYCAALQFAELHKAGKDQFKKVRKFTAYAIEKEACIAALKPFKATWKEIAPQEIKGRLVLKFPSAHQISNGERDTLCLVGALLTAGRKLQGDCAILIIDEVFDYLDDANLIACQYYVTEMIEQWRLAGRQLIPVILTHLDPNYFKNFTFKDQKVSYLARSTRMPDKKVHLVIQKRSHPSIESGLSTYFLHHHPNEADLTTEFAALGLDNTIATSSSFKAYLESQLERYVSDKLKYDPVSVCCAVRNLIEKKTYEMLGSDDDRTKFVETHKTADKLDFALERGLELPSQFFLLSVIFNEAAHVKPYTDFLTPLFSKLDNLTIKRMIREICDT
ncbi:hypothetical protein FHT79_003452 [Rhizobium sp. BK212]|uniref:ATP-binding cassette domain-containing protein n=1 Tax=Rhizobium sp. BK212 TaxID=2587074 RepID=UPI0016154E74|nr:ABC transporter ATP-binding protein [Rhizobium sp. BK212]MBB4216265.1 hypothetical protein [Rhizobium sp. BK212]